MTFTVLDLPTEPFVFVDETGVDNGPFSGEWFATLDDGTMVCSGHGGSPLYLRVTDVDGDWITTLDGTGRAFRYRIVPLEIDDRGRLTLPPGGPSK